MPSPATPAPAAPDLERVLAERAAKLATRRGRHTAPVETRALLLLKVGEQLIAFPAREVAEVARLDTFAPVPHAAPYLLGVVNIQNELHSLLSLEKLVGTAGTGDAPPARAVVLRHPELRLALACTEVPGVEEIPLTRIQPDGVIQFGAGFGKLLDTAAVLEALDLPIAP
jgi:chemotaxis signal transduction protein